MPEAFTILKLLLLLWAVNGAPVIATRLLGNTFARPVDNNLCLADGYPLFGSSKTWRGIVSALCAGMLLGWIVGMELHWGLATAGLAMCGDLLSSFIKRRRGMPASSRAVIVDQLPESLFPMLVLTLTNQLEPLSAVITVILFVVTDIWLSKLLYRIHIRRRPY